MYLYNIYLVNHENLRLMELINQLGKEKAEKAEKSLLTIEEKKEDNMNMDNMGINKTMTSRLRMTDYGKEGNNQSINITEIVDENDYLKEKFERINMMKKRLKISKKEIRHLNSEISNMNTKCFYLTKIFTEGMHELSKELLKIHEIQLDKLVNSKKNILIILFVENNHSNSLYFELYKDRSISYLNGSYNIDDQLKLPMISNNIQKKYNFPVLEKSDPTTFIYNAIKHMLEEHNNLNRSLSIRKKKFDWEEFRTFSAYQIYTILTLNKVVILL
jgi:hypothetical protein